MDKFLNVPTLLTVLLMVILGSCTKDKVQPDLRLKYIGKWNFKGNGHYFSGYYIYNPQPTWTYTENYWTDYNDSTGEIRLGAQKNELIIRYCETCPEEVYNLDQNGTGAWTLSETEFFNDVAPAPPGYTSMYQTYNVQGWKL